jgi:hypothetical protein
LSREHGSERSSLSFSTATDGGIVGIDKDSSLGDLDEVYLFANNYDSRGTPDETALLSVPECRQGELLELMREEDRFS